MPDIHQEIRLPAPPARVYRALATSEGHAAFTGAPAEIDIAPGGSWSAYGGGVTGRTLEAVTDVRLVQAWRAADWPAGTWSLVRFELHADGDGTRLVLDHMAAPAGAEAHLDAGWHSRYWEPLRAWLAA
jgi:uncharacterized protein YndB with AHSA1/START domain